MDMFGDLVRFHFVPPSTSSDKVSVTIVSHLFACRGSNRDECSAVDGVA